MVTIGLLGLVVVTWKFSISPVRPSGTLLARVALPTVQVSLLASVVICWGITLRKGVLRVAPRAVILALFRHS